MLGGISIRSMALLFESSRRRCFAPPLSLEPCCHACDRPVLLADVIRFESSRWCCLAPPLSPAPCPHRVLSSSSTGHCSMISHLSFRSMVSLFETPPSALPRASALARALLPCLLSSSSYWSMLDGLSIRSMAVLFESSRRCCLASPLSPELRCHACCRPVPAGRSLAVSRPAR